MTGKQIGCILMASGQSRRFGRNKLLEVFRGKTLLQRVLDLTGGELFHHRIAVTRDAEVKRICEQQGIAVIYHELPDRNDTVRLGICAMKQAQMDGCVFCPCDQPLLRRESLERMVRVFQTGIEDPGWEKGILRLSYGDRQGTPVLFDRAYFEELADLPPKCGGSWLIKKYPERVRLVAAGEERELYDIDTQEDLNRMSAFTYDGIDTRLSK